MSLQFLDSTVSSMIAALATVTVAVLHFRTRGEVKEVRRQATAVAENTENISNGFAGNVETTLANQSATLRRIESFNAEMRQDMRDLRTEVREDRDATRHQITALQETDRALHEEIQQVSKRNIQSQKRGRS